MNRRGAPARPPGADEVKTITVRQAKIEQDQFIWIEVGEVCGVLERAHPVDCEQCGLQRLTKALAEPFMVLDEQDPHRKGLSGCGKVSGA